MSWLNVDEFDDKVGGHAIVTVGVEFLRLHAARMLVSADVLLPFYTLRRGPSYDSGPDDEGNWVSTLTSPGGHSYVPITRLTVTLAF